MRTFYSINISVYYYVLATGRFTPRGTRSLNPSINPSPRGSVCHPEDASLPLVLCNLLQKEFSGARSPVAGGIGPMGFPLNNKPRRKKGEDQDDDEG